MSSSFIDVSMMNNTQRISHDNAKSWLESVGKTDSIATTEMGVYFNNNTGRDNGVDIARAIDLNGDDHVDVNELTAYFQTFFESEYSGKDSAGYSLSLLSDPKTIGTLKLNYENLKLSGSEPTTDNAELSYVASIAEQNTRLYLDTEADVTSDEISVEHFTENLLNTIPNSTPVEQAGAELNTKRLASLDGNSSSISPLELAAFYMASYLNGTNTLDGVTSFARKFSGGTQEGTINQLLKDFFNFLKGSRFYD